MTKHKPKVPRTTTAQQKADDDARYGGEFKAARRAAEAKATPDARSAEETKAAADSHRPGRGNRLRAVAPAIGMMREPSSVRLI